MFTKHPLLPLVASLVLAGCQTSDILFDFDGDGRADLLIGSPNNDAAGTDAGKTYLLFSPY